MRICGTVKVAQFRDPLSQSRRTSWTYILQTARSLFPKTCTEIFSQVPQHWSHNTPLDDSPVWHKTPGTMPPRQKSYYGSGDTVNLKEIAGSLTHPLTPPRKARHLNLAIIGLLGNTSATTRKEAIESKADLLSFCSCLSSRALAVPFLPSNFNSDTRLLRHALMCSGVPRQPFGALRQSCGMLRRCSGNPPGYSRGPPACSGLLWRPSDSLRRVLGPSVVSDPFLHPVHPSALRLSHCHVSFAPNWCLQL